MLANRWLFSLAMLYCQQRVGMVASPDAGLEQEVLVLAEHLIPVGMVASPDAGLEPMMTHMIYTYTKSRNGGKPGCGIRTDAAMTPTSTAFPVGMVASPDAGLEPTQI